MPRWPHELVLSDVRFDSSFASLCSAPFSVCCLNRLMRNKISPHDDIYTNVEHQGCKDKDKKGL